MTISTKRRRKLFVCVPGTDGCDETFDIISRVTGCQVASARCWDNRARARRAALDLTDALNKAFAGSRIDFNISGLARERQQVVVIWSVDDVRLLRPDLNADQAWFVLTNCEVDSRAGNGITRDLINSVARDLYRRSK